jgi:hypothetical protein
MRKICLLALVGLLMAGSWISVYPSSVQAADSYIFDGEGTLAKPFMVMKAEDMDHVRDYPAASYKLGADIDLSDYFKGEGWVPIGTSSAPFTGTFDGDEFLITNLFINRTTSNYVGLFGYTKDATLENIRIMNVDVTGSMYVGGLVGYASSTVVSGSSVSSTSGSVKASVGYVGGLAGYIGSPGAIIKHSYAAIDVHAERAGGLVGYMDSGGGLESSYASGDVTGSTYVGGLVYSARSPVKDTYATGNVKGTTRAGGLTAYANKDIDSSFQTGAVTGGDSESGILIGGIVNMTVTDLVYNTTHNQSLPAIGFIGTGGTVTGIQGLSDADMKTRAAYGATWDFDTVWGINEGLSYPYLRAFTPIVRVNRLAQASYGLNSLLTVDGFMMDGSLGEPVEVEYEILNASRVPVASSGPIPITLFSPTEDVQTYSFTETLDDTRFPEGTYTVNVTAKDLQGNQAPPTREVTFTVDHTPPVITLNGANPLQVSAGGTYSEPGATALDAVDRDLTPTVSGLVNTSVVGSYTITYAVTDAAGNTATKTRTVNVVSAGSGGGSSSVEPSNNANLAQLTLLIGGSARGLTPTFAPEITEYRIETDGEQIELQLSSADQKTIVTVFNQPVADKISIPLVVGTQKIKITVQAEDGTLRDYILTITRLAEQESAAPVSEACPFTDIQGHWAQAEICEAARLNIVEGVSKHNFAPNKAITRTEFAVMLLRTLQIQTAQPITGNSFSDMASIPEWARAAILTGQAKGIVNGYSDGTFRPQLEIVRAEMAVMLARALKWEPEHELELPFSDGASIPAWAQPYVKIVYAKGLLQGRGSEQFVPNGSTTRAEAAAVMLRLWKSLDEFQQ